MHKEFDFEHFYAFISNAAFVLNTFSVLYLVSDMCIEIPSFDDFLKTSFMRVANYEYRSAIFRIPRNSNV